MVSSPLIIYVDMDRTLCDYDEGYRRHQACYPDLAFPQSEPGLYMSLDPLPGALDTFTWLSQQPLFSVWILTAPSFQNPHCYSEKRLWVEMHLGMAAVRRLIISPNKGLNRGHYLIDDNVRGKGQESFEGELVHFGSAAFPNWAAVRNHFEQIIVHKGRG